MGSVLREFEEEFEAATREIAGELEWAQAEVRRLIPRSKKQLKAVKAPAALTQREIDSRPESWARKSRTINARFARLLGRE